jgi:hypothetical protein
MNKLEPCPICKGKALLMILPNGKFVIRCTDCKISSPELKDKEYLIFSWNNVPL